MKFQLKNVGKIKDAEFELKPLTVFIGANGSGKTYAASALWGIMKYLDTLNFSSIISKKIHDEIANKVRQECKKFSFQGEEKIGFVLSSEFTKSIYEQINSHLIITANKIVENVFLVSDLFEKSTILFQPTCIKYNPVEIDIEYSPTKDIFTTKTKCDNYKLTTERFLINFFEEKNFEIDDDDIFSIVNNIIKTIIKSIFFDDTNNGKSFFIFKTIYIPAARTGLMFITHDIIQNQFEHTNRFTFNETEKKQQNNDLTAPLNDFIAKIHNASRPKSELNTENQSFNQIMGGKLVQREGQYRFDFQPNGLEQTVPLSASSSLVTELAALSALEENIGYGTFIILEEPEAHLHLSAQREMAKLIVRLINEKGCRILLTTHSDTFLQQINNLIMLEKLSHHNENALADFGIQAAEVIAANDVAVYDFQCVGNETHVENLVCGEYGFVAKSMNDVLIALAKETQSIIEQIDDLEAE